MRARKASMTVHLLFWAALVGVPGLALWKEVRQRSLNQQLLAAITREDTPAALRALEQGADANARQASGVSIWERTWNQLRGRRQEADSGTTALLASIRTRDDDVIFSLNEKPELTWALLAHGARPNVADEYGGTPLSYAFSGGKSATARLLIEHGAHVTASGNACNDLLGAILLHDAALTEFMLDRGADPNGVSESGRTPLGAAVGYKDADIVRCLFRHHADPNQKSVYDIHVYLTPLEIANQQRTAEIARLLRNAGAR